MNATDITLMILLCAKHLVSMTKFSQKVADNNTCYLVDTQKYLKARNKKVALLQQRLAKGSIISGKTLTLKLELALSNITSLKGYLSHAKAELGSLKGIHNDH